MTPLDIEKTLERHMHAFSNEIRDNLSQLDTSHFNLNNTTISEAILYRMRSYYHQQHTIKLVLDKNKIAPAADFFVETVMFYLKAYCFIHKKDWKIESEKAVKRKRGALQPDITIWQEENLIVSIECKTQLGYNRFGWRDQHFFRKNQLQQDFPDVKTFLVVMTDVNWDGFKDDLLVGKELFTLSTIHPGIIPHGEEKTAILNPFENLISQL